MAASIVDVINIKLTLFGISISSLTLLSLLWKRIVIIATRLFEWIDGGVSVFAIRFCNGR
jgi:hypothetical protein